MVHAGGSYIDLTEKNSIPVKTWKLISENLCGKKIGTKRSMGSREFCVSCTSA